ncbi:MAG TPA: dsDNA nuclease domain-containing protein, partial [Candidatus Sulfopaludibacter sp.]|nr:dsDNA nuclease domain-containing protein [Candidatus Sulfopaludibacter sp.]
MDSEKGGKNAIRGFDYQKAIIAFLSVRMYCKKVELLRIICEYKNDIETENINHDLWSWQIKSTNLTKLSKEEILKSLDLFYELNRNNNYSRFILVCNKDISST